MTEETQIALKNYDWLLRSHGLEDVTLDWESQSLIYGAGGTTIETLLKPGFTPATKSRDT
jgi:hypothetical protein